VVTHVVEGRHRFLHATALVVDAADGQPIRTSASYRLDRASLDEIPVGALLECCTGPVLVVSVAGEADAVWGSEAVRQ
jgi:hypothetical protein